MLSKSQQAIAYLIALLKTPPGRFAVTKLCFLADVEARRANGRPITDFEYIRWDHGPWDQGIYLALEELDAMHVIRMNVEQKTGPKGPYTQFEYSTGEEASEEQLKDLSPVDRHILEWVADAYGGMKLPELREIAYSTKPMTDPALRLKAPLNMEQLDGELMAETGGVSLDQLHEARSRMRRGEGVPLASLLDGLDG